MTDLTVRRRAGLMAVVAGVAAALSAGYLWRFSQEGSGVALAVGLVLVVVAVGHAVAWSSARTPLLVADETGLRVRLGSVWTGLPWAAVERVDVEERGRLRDGRVVVVTVDEAGALAGADRRSRWAARLNRSLYGAPLVVPYGVTTSQSVVDVAGTLRRLAAGRAEVALVGAVEPSPEPTVELTGRTVAEPVVQTEPVVQIDPVAQSEPDPPPAPTAPDAPDTVDGDRHGAHPAGRPRRRLWAARSDAPGSAEPSRVSALGSGPARRAEVTMPVRPQHATVGGLALSEPVEHDRVTLPEIVELRRTSLPESTELYDPDRGNVSLIIDATTDLSARAMQKVRRTEASRTASGSSVAAGTAAPEPAAPGDTGEATLIGGQIAQARVVLGLSVDELAERTRIRPYVIDSIEADDFSPCGGDFYARGHLRMLARVLGVDPAPLVATYDETFATSPVNAREVFEVELATGTTGLVRGGESGAHWGALIAAVLVLILIWGVARFFTSDADHHPAGVQPADVVGTSEAPERVGSAPVETRTAQVKIASIDGSSTVVVTDSSGGTVFRGVLAAGSARKLSGSAPLRVSARTGVIRLGVRGHPLAVLGGPDGRTQAMVRALPAQR